MRNEDPFLDREFSERAKRLPLHRRYDPSHPHAYWRMKSQVIRLMQPGALAALPTAEQIFSRAIVDRVDPAELEAKALLDHGILSHSALRGDLDPMVATRIVEVEQWLSRPSSAGTTSSTELPVPRRTGCTGGRCTESRRRTETHSVCRIPSDQDRCGAMDEELKAGRVTFRQLWRWTRGSRRMLLIALLCALAGAGPGLAQPLIVNRTIEAATAAASPSTGVTSTPGIPSPSGGLASAWSNSTRR
ncbi:hypothetical protein [Streptomyces sp. bgisy029]|uniref:hypothetical protein n=1 Tax=Streptomyces sp. bgisy029 TaxID=3413771 RepID=UPI003D720269